MVATDEKTIDQVLNRGVAEVLPSKEELKKLLASGKKIRLYLGVDPTGFELHLGHSLALRKLQQFADLGHEVILLLGTFTGMIGDPTGKDQARQPLTFDQIKQNMADYKRQAGKILDFSKVKIKYNHTWLAKLNFEDVVKLASHFTVQQMIERDMFQQRLKANKPIHLHEFFYPLMQGYDSVAMDVDLEIGGTDQTFNMLAGRTLMKKLKNKQKYVLTIPLLLGLDGRKMSKTCQNYISLTDSPKDVYGKTMRLNDELIISWFELLTNLPQSQLDQLDSDIKSGRLNPMEAKKRLAFDLTAWLHGQDEAERAQLEFEQVFQKNQLPQNLTVVKLPPGRYSLINLLKKLPSNLSSRQIKNLISQKAVKINQQPVTNPNQVITLDKTAAPIVVRLGKLLFFQIKTTHEA
ncbi:MAG: tyrosine--tRNA ligase [bacterium]|nr:tyrosine--tRNA ligase [bacterium]